MSFNPTILIVDDSTENIDLLSNMLHADYKVKAALYGERAIKIAQKSPHPDMILSDIMMPGMDGYEVCKKLKDDPLTSHIPVIFISAMNELSYEKKGLELGAVDYISKPFNPDIVLRRIKTHIELYDQNRALAYQVKEYTDEILETRIEIINRLSRVSELKDNETGIHIIRMSHYSRLIADKLEETDEWKELIFQVAPMHDIGKVGIPDHILLKPGKLDAEEWEIMKRHSQYGNDIIGSHHSDIMKMARQVALYHHEKWDGSGYPHGLKGEEIPLAARIVAIADVFDALTSVRPYKKAWDFDQAIDYINQQSGIHFDPNLIPFLNHQQAKVKAIMKEYQDIEAMNIIQIVT
ncbi:MAG: response regulator [Pseudomonadota bacterium]